MESLWDASTRKGFDYLSSNKNYVTYGAEGFYPSNRLDTTLGALLTKGDLETPIRHYVEQGGTVLMTAFSAKVDEHSQWFNTPLPGGLSDVFGIRTSQFYRPDEMPEMEFEGKTAKGSIAFYELLEPLTAQTLATFANLPGHPPAVTVNKYGKGMAIYLAVPAQPSFLGPNAGSLYAHPGIEAGPKTLEGVYARVVESRALYVNTTAEEKEVAINTKVRGFLSHTTYEGAINLGPYQVEFVE